jgi:AcrR family transcriptional regulator
VPAIQERAQARYQQILDAALSVFTRRGYREALVDDIAAEAETSKGGVYFHFPGKQAIFLALLDRSAGLLMDRVREAVAAEVDPVAKADAALLAVLRLFSSHRALARLFLVEAMGAGPEFHAKLAALHAEFATFIRHNLDDAVRRGAIAPIDTEVASLVWFGALNQLVTRWVITDDPRPLEERYPALRTLLLRTVGLEVTA